MTVPKVKSFNDRVQSNSSIPVLAVIAMVAGFVVASQTPGHVGQGFSLEFPKKLGK